MRPLSGIILLVSASSLLPLTALAGDSLAVVAVAEPPGPSAELADLTNQLRVALDQKARGSPEVLTAAETKKRMTGEEISPRRSPRSTAPIPERSRPTRGATSTAR
jgi:hypothetical protein